MGLIMRKIALSLAMCCAMIIGVAQAMWDLEQPVGGVSDQFCKRPERPCTAFNYEVTYESVAQLTKP
ncbi:hypothetical protein D3C87_970400 [compost metagenome]